MYSDMKILYFKENVLRMLTPVTNIDENNTGLLRFYCKQSSIYIPDKTIDDYFKEENADVNGKYAIKIVEKLLIENGILEYGNALTSEGLIAFYLLHEEGHYIHYVNEYLNKGKNCEEYLNDYYEQTIRCEEKFKNECDSCKDDMIYMLYQILYRKIEFEEIADKYAIECIKGNRDILYLFKK